MRAFAVESQLFVHHRETILGRQAWRISSNSLIPDCFAKLAFNIWGLLGNLVGHGARLEPRLQAGILHGWFQGKVCPFEDWADAVSGYDNRQDVRQELNLQDSESAANVALDNVAGKLEWTPANTTVNFNFQNSPASLTHAMNDCLKEASRNGGRRILVALLCILSPAGEDVDAEIGIGLILMEAVNRGIGLWWKRLGVCAWRLLRKHRVLHRQEDERWNFDLLSGHGEAWTLASGLFG